MAAVPEKVSCHHFIYQRGFSMIHVGDDGNVFEYLAACKQSFKGAKVYENNFVQACKLKIKKIDRGR